MSPQPRRPAPYSLIRPLLFRLDPERVHALTAGLLRLVGAAPLLRGALRSWLVRVEPQPVRCFGLDFPNVVGLAAGYDKDGLAWRGLAALGFGHIEIGTVTPEAQPGNPRPRVFRLPGDRSMINRLGFPSRGAGFVEHRLSLRRPPGLVVGLNIGKQKETPLAAAAEDYVALMRRFAGRADYLVVNISSPNTPDLRELQQQAWLEPLLSRLCREKRELEQRLERRVPLLLKIAPDLDGSELERMTATFLASDLDGLVVSNTTIARNGLRSPAAAEAGGLSGAALTERSTALLREVRRMTGGRLPLVGCGGIMNPDDALEKLRAGASLVQVYTGLIFAGPGLVGRILREHRRDTEAS